MFQPQRFGNYLLLSRLATGGMAELFIARDERGREDFVVVKRVLERYATDPDFVSMFIDEARLTATLRHPNIIEVLDVGRVEGTYYIAFPWAMGCDLGTLAQQAERSGNPLSANEAAWAIARLSTGLDFAHTEKIVHRDVSPENVLVSRQGQVLIADFGIAHVNHSFSADPDNVLKGKPAYMSPEVAWGMEATARSDQFASALVLWELLTGAPAVAGETHEEMLGNVKACRISPAPPGPRRFTPALEALVMRALRAAPEDRYPDSYAFSQALDEYLASSSFAGGAALLGARVEAAFGPELDRRLARAQAIAQGFGAPSLVRRSTLEEIPVAPPTGTVGGAIVSPLDQVKPLVGTARGPIIGIDLGTTYSCAAFVKGGKPYVIPSREGHNTVPSVVSLVKGKILVGHAARAQLLTAPETTVYGAKRLIGRQFHSPVVEQIRERFSYPIVEGPAGEAAVRLGTRVFTLQELSAVVLAEVKLVAERHLEAPVQRAVITCPAFYNERQRQAVREAGALAGLHVERIINEPTAAALSYGYGRDLEKRILIYDLGGGTFDATVLELHSKVYEVRSTGGDTFLGGVDFDMRLVDHLRAFVRERAGKPLSDDRVTLQRLVDAAERTKIALSERESTKVILPYLLLEDFTPFTLDLTVTRALFTELCRPLVERTLQVCGEVLEAAGLNARDLDEVVLVGGMSRMPLVRALVEGYFGKPPAKSVHPDEGVALGAALLGHSLEQLEGVVLIDVLPMSICIGLPGGRVKRVVARNTQLPHTKSYSVATTRDQQRQLDISVFQGEADRVEENEFLGTLAVTDLPPLPKGAVKISLTFALSEECLLTVSAREIVTGRELKSCRKIVPHPQPSGELDDHLS